MRRTRSFYSGRWFPVRVSLVFFLFFIALSGQGSSASPEAPQQPPSPQAIETAPVIIDGMVLFELRGIRAYPAQDRAETVAGRIKKVALDPNISEDAITSVEAVDTTNVMAGTYFVMSVSDADAALEGITRRQLASVYADKIRAAVREHRNARTTGHIVWGILYACAATALFVISIFLILRLHRKLHDYLESVSKERIRELESKSLKIFGAEGIWSAVEDALKTVRFVIVFVLFYSYLEAVLRLFPWTRFFAIKLLDYVLDPLRIIGFGILREIPDLLFIVILVIIVRLFLKFLHIFFREIEVGARKISGFYPEWAGPTDRIVTFLIVAFAAVVAFPYIPGSSSAAFKGISLFIGVLFSLGSQSAVSNTIAGFIVHYRRAFNVGDWIQINNVIGGVTEIKAQITIIHTIKNEYVVVPNSAVLTSHIINYSSLARKRGLILHTEVTIGYDAPWRQVHAMLLMAAERTKGLLKDPSPFVLQKSLEDFYVRYELNVYTDMPQVMSNIYSELHKNIQDCFNEYGVQIMSPHYRGDPAAPKVVPKENWHAPPARSPEGVGENGD